MGCPSSIDRSAVPGALRRRPVQPIASPMVDGPAGGHNRGRSGATAQGATVLLPKPSAQLRASGVARTCLNRPCTPAPAARKTSRPGGTPPPSSSPACSSARSRASPRTACPGWAPREEARQILERGDPVVLPAHDQRRHVDLRGIDERQVGRHVDVGSGRNRSVEREHGIGERVDDRRDRQYPDGRG